MTQVRAKSLLRTFVAGVNTLLRDCIDWTGYRCAAITARYIGFVLEENINDLGYGAVTTPGSLLAYFEAARDYGSWAWEDIVAPAVAQAKQGFLVRPHVYFWWNQGADYGRVPVEQRLGFS